MELDSAEIRACYYALAALIRARPTVPPEVAQLYRKLDAAARCAVSRTRQENSTGTGESTDVEWIGSALAARLLGWTQRRVQRHAADLDAQLIGGRLVFRADRVRDYAEQLEAA